MSTLNVATLQNSGGTGTAATLASINGGPIAGARNRIINGDMRIDQRNAGAAVTMGSGVVYTVDRWWSYEDTDGTMTAQRSTVAPNGFTNSLLCTTTSADSSLSATQRVVIAQAIEGFNIADLGWGTANAQPITVSFWVRSSLTGSFGGAAKNANIDRSYPFSYSINSANTWEYKTVTISGPTSGTWATDNTKGIDLHFGLGVGSSYSGTAGSWANADLNSATGATSVVGTNGATFYITGVQLEAGTVATPFERRSYGQELALCQRYYQLARSIAGCGNSSSQVAASVVFQGSMRATPTLGQTGVIQVADGVNDITQSSTSILFLNGADNAVVALLGNFSGLTANRPYIMRLNANTNAITLSAEL